MHYTRQEKVAWAIGIFEGEGAIVFGRGRCVAVAVQMTDRDVLQRVFSIFKVGTFRGPYTYNGNKPYWAWTVGNGIEVKKLLMSWLPFLGKRRRARAEDAIDRLKNLGQRKIRTHCFKGHEWNKENTYISPKTKFRMCRQCRKLKIKGNGNSV